MAMPSSGSIALRTCISGIACSSISCAVAGVACSPTSLSSISVQAGKTAPHCMREFYGYAVVSNLSVSPNFIATTDYAPYSTTVNLSSPSNWTSTAGDTWITNTPTCGNAGNTTVTVCLARFQAFEGEVRNSYLRFCTSTDCVSVSIQQGSFGDLEPLFS